jgi:hypothetical protein
LPYFDTFYFTSFISLTHKVSGACTIKSLQIHYVVMQSVVMQSVVMQSVIMLSVVMLSVVMLSVI